MKSWIIPCSPKKYDVEAAFEALSKINWKQTANYQVGDVVYIYVGCPVKAILFKCRVTKVNLERFDIDTLKHVLDGRDYLDSYKTMELELIRKYDPGVLTLRALQANGLTGTVRGPRTVPATLGHLISTLGD